MKCSFAVIAVSQVYTMYNSHKFDICSENRKKVDMTWCLAQGTEETVVCMDGICGENSSGTGLETLAE